MSQRMLRGVGGGSRETTPYLLWERGVKTNEEIRSLFGIQKQFLRHMDLVLDVDPKIEELLRWESDKDIMAWLYIF